MHLYSVIINGKRGKFTASDIEDARHVLVKMNDRGHKVIYGSLNLVADKQKLK